MNVNYIKIFQLFSEESNKEESSTTYEDLKNHPIYYLGMFKKLMNYTPISREKITQYIRTNSLNGVEVDDISRAGKSFAYNRAWHYVQNFDIKNKVHIKNLKEYANDELLISLTEGIKFFESTTEYEKCAFLKKILDKAPKPKNK